MLWIHQHIKVVYLLCHIQSGVGHQSLHLKLNLKLQAPKSDLIYLQAEIKCAKITAA